MGRFYCGQISGKFWFGVQSSNDASYFGVKHNDIVQYHVCGCELDGKYIEQIVNIRDCAEEDGTKYYEETHVKVKVDELFCEDCFDSFTDHKQAMLDDDIDFDGNTWYLSDTEIYYQFETIHIDIVKENIQTLETEVGKYMDSYTLTEDCGEITYDYKCPDKLTGHELMLVARLCLGKQILHCLNTHGRCVFSAEL